MTDDNTTTHDPGADKASGEVDSKAAGKKTVPPGNGDLDQRDVEKGSEQLGRVEAGH